RQCGYNLRGLTESGRCPECGLDIIESTQISLLMNSDRAWARRLTRGALLIVISPVIYTLYVYAEVGSGLASLYEGAESLDAFFTNVARPLLLISVASLLTGICMFATPEPGAGTCPPTRAMNWFIRVCALLTGAVFLAFGTYLPNLNDLNRIAAHPAMIMHIAPWPLVLIPLHLSVLLQL